MIEIFRSHEIRPLEVLVHRNVKNRIVSNYAPEASSLKDFFDGLMGSIEELTECAMLGEMEITVVGGTSSSKGRLILFCSEEENAEIAVEIRALEAVAYVLGHSFPNSSIDIKVSVKMSEALDEEESD